jgi:hypothetical protein
VAKKLIASTNGLCCMDGISSLVTVVAHVVMGCVANIKCSIS